MKTLQSDIDAVWAAADCLYTEAQLEPAIERLAASVEAQLGATDPVVICVLNGGLVTTGRLLPKFSFSMQLDCVHATRYRNGTRGHTVEWLCKPRTELAGRTVLLVDDIYDEGVTLAAIQRYCRDAGAARVYTAVLVDKQHDRKDPQAQVDFTAVSVPDRYVFGFGMDYCGYLRNAPGIYAVNTNNNCGGG
ncbi:hypoxanthine-guanine phosphoribosyltransferase [Exilibacterium tricleocarpae]|uniref:Hypoxanthine-guanine phosphoribosyltransferase n=1 Tax=Exilibacterium tricleocarpae TaxID=2591008 RepID=A0A545TVW3_9GAMM|nr:hypoxanthine-guanine phosphoribosyltransferase [Exilibacterium tricleocarpae]TQV81356.1 hypoxanthine-guanine phosphoribosyltransferase [Exilibacterium tricleocarpae]